ncbi:MAG: hypothetical protein ACTSQE_03130 [Candidatus Heimdallarchaeaceae archaeon]
MEENLEVKINGKSIPLNSFMKRLFHTIILTLLDLLKRPDNSEIESYEISTSK